MTSSQATCLLCLSTDKSTINFSSDRGRELNIVGILIAHFWFKLDELKVLSPNICCDCWQKTEIFHQFYQSIRTVHKEFETVSVKKEKELDIEDDGEMYKLDELSPQDFNIELVKMENDTEDDESSDTFMNGISHTNSIETTDRMSCENEMTRCTTPTELIETANSVAAIELLPATSKARYNRVYKDFINWKKVKGAESSSQRVLLAYFGELSAKSKPSTLLSAYSMLKATLKIYDYIDIGMYQQLIGFLKSKAKGYKPNAKAKVFSQNEIHEFIDNAPDELWLDLKVACIIAVSGACRSHELIDLNVEHIRKQGDVFKVTIPQSKKDGPRKFSITGKFFTTVDKYAALRPQNTKSNRFFLNFQRGKCTVQCIGKNKFHAMPRRIATFLKLAEPEQYTGSSFRRTSETILSKIKATT